jgi:hypothetical protein
MNDLENYLRMATRGLWGKRKLEVREELEAHVLERAHKHELLGLTREDAISKSMQELGNARVINQCMMEVYMLSKQPLLGVICTCALASFGFWQASLPRAFRVQCKNTAQTFQFSGTTTGTFLKRMDASGLALALQDIRHMRTEDSDTRISDDPLRVIETTAKNATFEHEQQEFYLEGISLRIPRGIGQVHCAIQ